MRRRRSCDVVSFLTAAMSPNSLVVLGCGKLLTAQGLSSGLLCLPDNDLPIALSARPQASFVAQQILRLQDGGVELNAMAVLYRAHFHSMELQMELTSRGIPFRSDERPALL